jgi:hypothetical protein
MKAKLSTIIQVISLVDTKSPSINEINTDSVDEYFEQPLKKLSEIIQNETLNEWTLTFSCVYVTLKKLRMYKRGTIYRKDKEKEMSIAIPIPLDTDIDWGVKEKPENLQTFFPIDERKFIILEPDFHLSNSMQNHVISCIKRGITAILQEGFTVSGHKIKVKESIFE